MESSMEQECRVLVGDEPVADGYLYKVDIYTSDGYGAGTDANVMINIHGEDGSTGQQVLDNSGNNFERGMKDHFKIVSKQYLGRITKIRIGHDNSGLGPAWLLGRVMVEDVKSHEVFEFLCNRWLSTEEDDGLIARELTWTSVETKKQGEEGHYTVHIHTGDVWGAGTDANVLVTLYGTKGDSGEHKLDNEGENNFERAMKDTFNIKSPQCLGHVYKVRIGHDNTGWGPGWYLDKVVVEDDSSGEVMEFHCDRWFATDADDGLITRELMREGFVEETDSGLEKVTYTLHIYTGDVWGAGTDANLILTLYGTAGESEEFQIENEGQTTFERAMTDTHQFECSCLGELTKIRIGHDNTGWGPAWYLDKVTVDDPKTGDTALFPCGKWFATDYEDGLITRDLIREGGPQHKIIIDGVDKENLKGEPLGLESRGISDDQITSSSHAEATPPSNARLNNDAAWCTADSNDCWLQVDLGVPYCVTSVATQGNPAGNNDFVKKYKLMYSDDGENWTTHEENGNQIFDGNEDSHIAKTVTLQQVMVGRYVRFCPAEWYCWPCLRVEIYGVPIKEDKTEITTETKVIEQVVVVEDDTAVESAPPANDETDKAQSALQSILDEELQMAAAEERKKKIEEEKQKIDDEMKRLEEERERHVKQKEEERKQREEEAKKKLEDEERLRIEAEEKKRLEEEERKKRVEEELKRIDDEHRQRLDELDRQVKEEEEKLRKEREEKERAEAEELRRWEEEMKKKEEEAKNKQDEERRKMEEEKKRWEEERQDREEELKRKHEEEQRKREDEWKEKEEAFVKGLQEAGKIAEPDEETTVVTTVTEVVVESSPDDEGTIADVLKDTTPIVVVTDADTEAKEKEDEEERKRKLEEERRQKIEDERKEREEKERKRLEEAEELERIMVEMRKKAEREDEEKQKREEEEEQRRREEAKRIKEEEERKKREVEEKKKLEEEEKLKKQAEKEKKKILKRQRQKSLTGSTSSLSSSSSSSSSSEDEEKTKWVSNVELKGFNAPIADMDDDEEGVTRIVTYRTKTTTTTRVVSWPGTYFFKPIEPGQPQATLPEEVGVIFGLEEVNPYKGQACCDHLKPVDPAVKTAQESSFNEKLTEESRPVSSWYGDTGSILQLYTPLSAIKDDDIERLMDWEAEGTQGWKRVKKSRDCEIWSRRSFEGGPPVTKAIVTLNGIPYSEVVQLLRDWNTRKEWDKTFDSVEVIDTIEQSRLIHCPVKKRDFVLATLDKEDKEEPYFASAWRNTSHPNTVQSKYKPLKLDYLFSGLVVRPLDGSTDSSRLTIICQVKGAVPSQAKSTYLTASPQKWIADLKKFYSKRGKDKKAQES